MFQGDHLTGKLLISMPSMRDVTFDHCVILVCLHSEEGALGLVINQPHPVSMDLVMQQLGFSWGDRPKPSVLQGGPVAPERGFILYEEEIGLPGYVPIFDNLYMGTNPDILLHFAQSDQSQRFLFALGYAGWGAGQLEAELRSNAWLVVDLDRQVLFDTPLPDRWSAAIRLLGVAPEYLMDTGSSAIN